jgi:hypothetical protein
MYGYLLAIPIVMTIPFVNKKIVLMISGLLSASASIAGFSRHLPWLIISKILFTGSWASDMILNCNGKHLVNPLDEYFWSTFAGTGIITLVSTHSLITLFSLPPTSPLLVSLLASVLSLLVLIKDKSEIKSHTLTLKDYYSTLKSPSILVLSNVTFKILFETIISILLLIWTPALKDLSTDYTIPSGLFICSLCACMYFGNVIAGLYKQYSQEISVFSVFVVTLSLGLLKSLCVYCIDVDQVVIVIYGVMFVAIGAYLSSSRVIGSTLVGGLVIWMMQDNYFDVIFKGLFWICASAFVIRSGVYFTLEKKKSGGLII